MLRKNWKYNPIISWVPTRRTGGISEAPPGGDPGIFTEILDTFTTGTITGTSDNGAQRNLISSLGNATITGGQLVWQQKAGLDTNPSLLTWEIQQIGGTIDSYKQVDTHFPTIGQGYRVYFACSDITFQNGWVLDYVPFNKPVLYRIDSGVETTIANCDAILFGAAQHFVNIKITGSNIYIEVNEDGSTYSRLYECPMEGGIGLIGQHYGVALKGTGTGSACEIFETSNNTFFVVDTFYNLVNPGDLITDYNTNNNFDRVPIAGEVRYDASGIGAVWADDGFATSPAIVSYGALDPSASAIIALVKELTPSPIYLYLNCDATFENGWAVKVDSLGVYIVRIDAGVESTQATGLFVGSDDTAPAARLTISNIGGNINVDAIGMDGLEPDGDTATVTHNMGGMYDTQDIYGFGLTSGAAGPQIVHYTFG